MVTADLICTWLGNEMWIHDISENQFSVSTQILYPELRKNTMLTLQMFLESSFEPGDWTLHYRTPWACDGTNAGWYSVNSEVGAAGQSVQLLSPGLRYKVWGFFFPECGQFQSEINPCCGPPEQELSTPWWQKVLVSVITAVLPH